MARARPVTSLDLDQDAGAVRRAWRFERAGWVIMALAIAGGLAGAFGDGPLSSATVVSADGRVRVSFERVVRYRATSTLEVRLAPDGAGDTTAIVSLDTAYLHAVEVMRVTPEPVRVRARSDRVEYQLLRPDPAHSMMLSFVIQPGAPGPHRVRLETSSGSLEFAQLVLP